MMTRKILSVILGLLMIIAGVYCFFTPVETLTVIPFVLGIVMIGDGIGCIFTWFDIRNFVRPSAWKLVSAVVSLIFGIMLAFSPVLQMSVGVFVILLTSWWILALGIIRIVHAFHLLKIRGKYDRFGFGDDRLQLVDRIDPWNSVIYLWLRCYSQPNAGAWRDRRAGRLQRNNSRHQPDISWVQPLAAIKPRL